MVDMDIKCTVDTSQLDDALRKADLLLEKHAQARALGLVPAGMVIAFDQVRRSKPVSRRALLGFRWLRTR